VGRVVKKGETPALKYSSAVTNIEGPSHEWFRQQLCLFLSHTPPTVIKRPRRTVEDKKLSLFLVNYRAMNTYVVIKHYAMKTWGLQGIAPRILNLGARWKWDFSFTHRPLYSRRKILLYPFDRRLDVPQSRSGRGGEEKGPLPRSSQHSITGRSARSLVTVLTELPRSLRRSISI
jgi:hypothetical protein